jgi:hypothetical protein
MNTQGNEMWGAAQGRMGADPSTKKFDQPKSHLKYKYLPGGYLKDRLLRRIDAGEIREDSRVYHLWQGG